MKTIYINRVTETVQLQPSSFTFIVEVEDSFNPSKTIIIDDKPTVIDFAQNAIFFSLKDILEAKYQNLLDSSSYDYILADMFLNEEDLDLTDINHKANTGMALVQLLPLGQVKTKSIELEVAAKEFELLEGNIEGAEIYVNDIKFTNGKVSLSEAVDNVVIKFINVTNKFINLKSYAIAY